MCAKFGCGPTVVSKKGGGGVQTDRQTKKTAALYSRLAGTQLRSGGLKKLSIFSAVHKMFTPKTSTPPHPPPGFNIFFIDFLGSS